MQLHSNPLTPFEKDNSPLSLHARLRWMNAGSRDDAKRRRAIDALLRQQSPDGSFAHSVARTIIALFDLHLLHAAPDRHTLAAINFLLETHLPPLQGICGGVYDGMFFRVDRPDRHALRHLRNLPFTNGCGGFVKTGAALYFAAAFHQGDPHRIATAHARINTVARQRHGRLCSGPCANNLLQACALDPTQRHQDAATLTAAYLATLQTPAGTWTRSVPFFPTLNALARLHSRPARLQFDQALSRALATQSRTGTWGRTSAPFNAYTLLDAAEARNLKLTW